MKSSEIRHSAESDPEQSANIAAITVRDAENLIEMLEEVQSAVEKDIDVGYAYRDSPREITEGVLSMVEFCVIHRWLSRFFPERYKGCFPPGDGYLDEYEFEE